MSTTIYEKDLPITKNSEMTKNLSFVRFAMAKKDICKCGYQITIGNQYVTLDAKQMESLMRDLQVFFYAEGYP